MRSEILYSDNHTDYRRTKQKTLSRQGLWTCFLLHIKNSALGRLEIGEDAAAREDAAVPQSLVWDASGSGHMVDQAGGRRSADPYLGSTRGMTDWSRVKA